MGRFHGYPYGAPVHTEESGDAIGPELPGRRGLAGGIGLGYDGQLFSDETGVATDECMYGRTARSPRACHSSSRRRSGLFSALSNSSLAVGSLSSSAISAVFSAEGSRLAHGRSASCGAPPAPPGGQVIRAIVLSGERPLDGRSRRTGPPDRCVSGMCYAEVGRVMVREPRWVAHAGQRGDGNRRRGKRYIGEGPTVGLGRGRLGRGQRPLGHDEVGARNCPVRYRRSRRWHCRGWRRCTTDSGAKAGVGLEQLRPSPA